MLLSTVLTDTLKIKKTKLQLFGLVMIQKILKKFHKQLHSEVSKAANGLKKLGIKKGDRVTIYLTMIPELS